VINDQWFGQVKIEVEVEVEVEKSPHKAQKNTEIEGRR
jgi:hypothetical protein